MLTLGMLTAGGKAKPKAPVQIGSSTISNNTSFSHTVVAGTKCLIVRGIVGNDTSSSSMATCSWNGQSMTRKAYAVGDAGNRFACIAIFYLLNPTPGTGNVAISGTSSDVYSAENWGNVSDIGNFKTTGGSSNLSSFSHSFSKTDPLNVLISAGLLRVGTGWTAGSNNIEEYDASISWGRAYFGRCESASIAAASCGGGTNTFAAASIELIAG